MNIAVTSVSISADRSNPSGKYGREASVLNLDQIQTTSKGN